ncbi:MAG: hypothetical protein U1F43_24735 [Myxococcota bacterium]
MATERRWAKRARPATFRSVEVLPAPAGPTKAATVPRASSQMGGAARSVGELGAEVGRPRDHQAVAWGGALHGALDQLGRHLAIDADRDQLGHRRLEHVGARARAAVLVAEALELRLERLHDLLEEAQLARQLVGVLGRAAGAAGARGGAGVARAVLARGAGDARGHGGHDLEALGVVDAVAEVARGEDDGLGADGRLHAREGVAHGGAAEGAGHAEAWERVVEALAHRGGPSSVRMGVMGPAGRCRAAASACARPAPGGRGRRPTGWRR